jgi:hypothetical protein
MKDEALAALEHSKNLLVQSQKLLNQALILMNQATGVVLSPAERGNYYCSECGVSNIPCPHRPDFSH